MADTFRTRLMLMLMQDEEVRPFAYDDKTGKKVLAPAGKLTIGIGRNLQDRGLADDEIQLLLENDCTIAINYAERIFPDFCTYEEERRLAIVNLIFNNGPFGFMRFKDTIAAIRARDWRRAAFCLKDSKWYHQVGDRAVRVIKLLEEAKDTYDKRD